LSTDSVLTSAPNETAALPTLLAHNLRQMVIRGGVSGLVVNALFQLSVSFPVLVPVTWGMCVVWLLVMGYWIRLGLVGPTAAAFPLAVRRLLYRWTIRLLWLAVMPVTLKLGVIPLAGVVAAPMLQLAFALAIRQYSDWLIRASTNRPGLRAAEWVVLLFAVGMLGVVATALAIAVWMLSILGASLS
jgi:hypothetical protein